MSTPPVSTRKGSIYRQTVNSLLGLLEGSVMSYLPSFIRSAVVFKFVHKFFDASLFWRWGLILLPTKYRLYGDWRIECGESDSVRFPMLIHKRHCDLWLVLSCIVCLRGNQLPYDRGHLHIYAQGSMWYRIEDSYQQPFWKKILQPQTKFQRLRPQ